MTHLPFADVFSNVYAIILAGFCLGIIGGFYGLSGSFFTAPLLHSLGFPMAVAVGTSLTHQFGRSVFTAVKNNALSHTNWKFGAILGFSGAGGIYLAKVILLNLEDAGIADTAARSLYIFILISFCLLMLWEHLRSRRAGSTTGHYERISDIVEKIRRVNLFPMVQLPGTGGKGISLWFLVAFGAATGLLSGLLGLSGSLIRLPALVFLTGLPLVPALCTDLLASLITLGFGTAGLASAGKIEMAAAMLLLTGSAAGSQLGHLAARHVSRSRAKLAFMACAASVPAGLFAKHLGYATPAVVLTFGAPLALSLLLMVTATASSLLACRQTAGFPVAKEAAQGEK